MDLGMREFRGSGNREAFRRMLKWSLALHVGLLVVVLVAPAPSGVAMPRAIRVDLVAAPSTPAPKPAPPAPPKAPPPPALKKKIVLPERPRAVKSAPRPPPKRPREVVLEPEIREEKSLEEVLAEMRGDAGEVAPAPVVAAREPSARNAQAVPQEVLEWVRAVKRHVRRAWVVPRGFRSQMLETHVMVELDASGRVIGRPRVVRTSGNPWFDDGVVRGIDKASPLPAPPEPGRWPFVFAPEDSF
ncbi:MAG: TonB C-terminal domain-containing protein [Myxococcota bacterium]